VPRLPVTHTHAELVGKRRISPCQSVVFQHFRFISWGINLSLIFWDKRLHCAMKTIIFQAQNFLLTCPVPHFHNFLTSDGYIWPWPPCINEVHKPGPPNDGKITKSFHKKFYYLLIWEDLKMSSFLSKQLCVWTKRLKPILCDDRYISVSVLTLLQAAVASNPVTGTQTRGRLHFEIKGLFLPFNTSCSSHQIISSLISTPSSSIIWNKVSRESV